MRAHTIPRTLPLLTVITAALLLLGVAGATPALASAGEGCPNEQLRSEADVNLATGQPYSLGLPECRAYEMVSPPEKNNSGIYSYGRSFPAAADGDAVGFMSQNAFGDAENYLNGGFGIPGNEYVARRTESGWETSSAVPSRTTLAHPDGTDPLDGTPDLSRMTTCGLNVVDNYTSGADAICAAGQPGGPWLPTPEYPGIHGGMYDGEGVDLVYLGASSNLSDMLFESFTIPFLAADVSTERSDGLYEIVGLGEAPPQLRLVNVNDDGEEIGTNQAAPLGGPFGPSGEAVTCEERGSGIHQNSYRAISEDGATVYFTACPSNVIGGVNVLYARVGAAGAEPRTLDISNPAEEGAAECTMCSATAASAAYQGASADGSKVFFTTSQQLLNSDTDTTADLYEYDFDNPPGQRLIQVSGGGAGDLTPGAGAEVQGMSVTISADGSHIYFVAKGVLTTVPNAEGQVAQAGADNLYSWQRDAAYPQGDTRFVGPLCSGSGKSGAVGMQVCPTAASASDSGLWEKAVVEHQAQTTPDGRYLVFTTYARLITSGPEADTDNAADVYRYDSQTGELRRISIGESGYPASNNGNTDGMSAEIAPLLTTTPVGGARADISDFNRAISENGEEVVFHTPEPLQADDVNTGADPSCATDAPELTGCDVYLWHECSHQACEAGGGNRGEVHMISDGQDANSTETQDGDAAISASGSDVFFFTATPLVGQDSDSLTDMYDARVDGGFPAPTPETASCSGEACQGKSLAPPATEAPGTASLSGVGNLASGAVALPTTSKPKPKTKSTVAQQLAKVLKLCKRDKRKRRRLLCEKRARHRYVSPKSSHGKKHM